MFCSIQFIKSNNQVIKNVLGFILIIGSQDKMADSLLFHVKICQCPLMHLSYPLMSVLRRINEVLPQFIQSLLGKIILFMKKEWRGGGGGGGEID